MKSFGLTLSLFGLIVGQLTERQSCPLITITDSTCPELYEPVIGFYKGSLKLYGNSCEACVNPEVEHYYALQECNIDIDVACNEYNPPVCGIFSEGSFQQFSNFCEACFENHANYFYHGVCTE